MKNILLILLLSGCTLAPTKPDAIIAEKKVNIDPRALEPCAELATLTSGTFEDLLDTHIRNSQSYLDCKTKQDTSIKLLKSFSNKE